MRYLRVLLAGVACALLLIGCGGDDDVSISPVATDDTASTASNVAISIDVTANDTDADGAIDPTTVTVTEPDNGTVAVDGTTGAVTYTPDLDFVGTDTFTYTVDDDQGNISNVATVTVTVTTTPDFDTFVQQVLALDANSEPVAVNNLDFQNQFAAGDPVAVDTLLP